jgi:hypothetical protein
MRTTVCRLALGLACLISIAPAQAGFELTNKGPIKLYTPVQRISTFDSCTHLFPKGKAFPLTIVSADWLPRGLCQDPIPPETTHGT